MKNYYRLSKNIRTKSLSPVALQRSPNTLQVTEGKNQGNHCHHMGTCMNKFKWIYGATNEIVIGFQAKILPGKSDQIR